MKKTILILVLGFLSLTLFGCSRNYLIEDSIEIVYGEKLQMKLQSDVKTEEIEWFVDNEAVLDIDDDGKITALSLGKATVEVRIGKTYDSCDVTVLSDFEISFSSVTIPVGQVREIAALTKQEGEIFWFSSDESIVTVEQWEDWESFMVLVAINPGEAEITVEFGDEVLTCFVTVTPMLAGE